jgi:hypothetical protein
MYEIPFQESSIRLAVEFAKQWILDHSCHKQDCHAYTKKYMDDSTIHPKLSDWLMFYTLVSSMGFETHVDVCDNEWFEDPKLN